MLQTGAVPCPFSAQHYVRALGLLLQLLTQFIKILIRAADCGRARQCLENISPGAITAPSVCIGYEQALSCSQPGTQLSLQSCSVLTGGAGCFVTHSLCLPFPGFHTSALTVHLMMTLSFCIILIDQFALYSKIHFLDSSISWQQTRPRALPTHCCLLYCGSFCNRDGRTHHRREK